jgi:hypothetical protein
MKTVVTWRKAMADIENIKELNLAAARLAATEVTRLLL